MAHIVYYNCKLIFHWIKSMKKTALMTATLYCELDHQILILDTTQELDITRLMDILGKIAN